MAYEQRAGNLYKVSMAIAPMHTEAVTNLGDLAVQYKPETMLLNPFSVGVSYSKETSVQEEASGSAGLYIDDEQPWAKLKAHDTFGKHTMVLTLNGNSGIKEKAYLMQFLAFHAGYQRLSWTNLADGGGKDGSGNPLAGLRMMIMCFAALKKNAEIFFGRISGVDWTHDSTDNYNDLLYTITFQIDTYGGIGIAAGDGFVQPVPRWQSNLEDNSK